LANQQYQTVEASHGSERMADKEESQPTALIDASPRELPAPLLLRADQAAALCSTSARTWRMWDAAGKIPRAIRIGRCTYWRPEELKAWVAAGCPDRRVWKIIQEE
jgi:predicted DNA-binding transcriptional regulator AlpA